MSQVIFSGSSGTIPNLNQNFTQLYGLRELISDPAYTAATPKFAFDASGNFLSASAGLGYGAGSGGAVTQATSKSTGVTINKLSGKITMNVASLAAGTTVQFTVTNSAVGAFDAVVLALAGSMASSANYNVWTYVLSGSFQVNVKNISAGALAEALSINFCVIKGSAS